MKISMKESLQLYIDFVLEAKIDDLKKKNPEFADEIEFFRDVPQKYIEWIAKHISPDREDNENLKLLILSFDELVKRNKMDNKDINSYDDVDLLRYAIDHGKEKMSSTEKRKDVKSQTDVVYKDERFLLVKPYSMEASCYYGAGTKWCIAAREDNYFKSYSAEGFNFLFVIDKKPTKSEFSKVAFAYHPSRDEVEIYDAVDDMRQPNEFIDYYPEEIKEKINEATGKYIFHIVSPEEKKTNEIAKKLGYSSGKLLNLMRSESRRDQFEHLLSLLGDDLKNLDAILVYWQQQNFVPKEDVKKFYQDYTSGKISFVGDKLKVN